MQFPKESVDVLDELHTGVHDGSLTPENPRTGILLRTLLKILLSILGKRDEDYLTADEASRFLGVSRRNFFDSIKPTYNLKCEKFGNANIGYLIDDLEIIKSKLPSS